MSYTTLLDWKLPIVITWLLPNVFSQTFTVECYFFLFSYQKSATHLFFSGAKPLFQMVYCVEWVRKPMYYSYQPITTCSGQSEQKFSNIPSYALVLGSLLYHRSTVITISSHFCIYFFFYLAFWLHWSGKFYSWLDELGKCSRTKRECDSSQKAALLLCVCLFSLVLVVYKRKKKHFKQCNSKEN